MLQYIAVCCSVLQRVAKLSILHRVIQILFFCCIVWQYVAERCSLLQRVAKLSILQHVVQIFLFKSTSESRCAALCCSVLQCVAVCGSVVQCVAVLHVW